MPPSEVGRRNRRLRWRMVNDRRSRTMRRDPRVRASRLSDARTVAASPRATEPARTTSLRWKALGWLNKLTGHRLMRFGRYVDLMWWAYYPWIR